MPTDVRGYVVVLLTASECDANPATRCVMEVIGPFRTREHAAAELARWPDWTTPHVMAVHEPEPRALGILTVRADLL